jgi:hypothetical protein
MTDFFKKEIEYFASLPCKNQCAQLYADISNCINNNIAYKRGEFDNSKFFGPNCFEFTKCNEFKLLYKHDKLQTIKYNIRENKAAYTKSYEIKYNNGDLEVAFDWRDYYKKDNLNIIL